MGDNEVIKCQNCQVPLELDTSLMDLSLAQRNLLMNSTIEPTTQQLQLPPDRLRRLNSIEKVSNLNLQPSVLNNLESYVFLNDDSGSLQHTRLDGESSEEADDDNAPKILSSRVNTLTNIFNLVSSKSNIDYPVCQDCLDALIHKLKGDYEEALKERDTYTEFLDRLNKQQGLEQSKPQNVNGALEEERAAALKEQEELLQELISLERTEAELDSTIEELEEGIRQEELSQLRKIEAENARDLEELEFSKELQSLKNQYETTLNGLDKLRKTNIFNETFRISHDGPFGTINELRLGGLDEIAVPWQEINAALGQVVLLLATICARLKFRLDGYILMPMGSYSKIERFDSNTQEWHAYDAFNNGSFRLGRFFHKETSFDRAMVSILEIISQITSHLSEGQPTDTDEIELPYTMQGDKINGVPIKLCGNNPGPDWTVACKFLLTNSKWLLAFSSSAINGS